MIHMKKIIWGNCLVKNEDCYLFFALMSAINYLDKILVWDTGSSDSTVEIIKYLQKKFPKKITFKEYGEVDENQFTKVRQKMLDQTQSDWLFLLDGDEVWWRRSINKIVETIHKVGEELDLIVNPTINLVGDIYHFQEEEAGNYEILGKRGHFNIRAINRKIPGLHVKRPYGQEGYFDGEGKHIQKRDSKRIIFLDTPYLHFTHLRRSSVANGDQQVMQRSKKNIFELGESFPEDFKYPEVLHLKRPNIVPNPWSRRSKYFLLRSLINTPLRKLKRRLTRY